MSVQATEIFDAYFKALIAQDGSWKRYTADALWTPIATQALAVAGVVAFPLGARTAKGHRDQHGRAEYLTLDVCITDPNSWGPPLFVAEHENMPRKAKIQYCAWKLLSTGAQRRVLVAYHAAHTDVPSAQALEDAVREVCTDNAGSDMLLIAGEYDARPASAAQLVDAHVTRIVGAPTN